MNIIRCAAFRTLSGLVAIVLSFSNLNAASRETGLTVKEKLVVGYVSENPRKEYKKLKPMAEYVASQLADLGIVGAEVRITKSQDEMIRLLKSGQVDWISETAFGAVKFHSESEAQPVLVRSKGGAAEYSSLIFVRKDSGINKLQELKGKTIAFEDAGSTSGYFIPKLALQDAGVDLQLLQGYRQVPDDDRLGYLFSGADQNSSAWVFRGVVDGAAVSDQDWSDGDDIPAVHREAFKILYRSEPYPRAIELVGVHVSPELRERLVGVLLASPSDPAAVYPLRRYHKTTDFQRLTADQLKLMDRLEQLQRLVGGSP